MENVVAARLTLRIALQDYLMQGASFKEMYPIGTEISDKGHLCSSLISVPVGLSGDGLLMQLNILLDATLLHYKLN